MTVAKINDHVAVAQSRLVSQYADAPRVNALIAALASRTQVLEDAIADVADNRALYGDKAEGAQLDAIGALIGFERNGLDDVTYRVMIRGKIATNTSRGTLGDIENIAKTLFNAQAVYATTPNAPGHDRNRAFAELSLAVGSPKSAASLTPRILKLIRTALPAGVVLVSVSFFDAKRALACDGPQPWVMGLADSNGQGGGLLANLIDNNALA